MISGKNISTSNDFQGLSVSHIQTFAPTPSTDHDRKHIIMAANGNISIFTMILLSIFHFELPHKKTSYLLCVTCTADQRLCFRYMDSAIDLLLKSKI